jgi:hypothetical protein
MEIVVSWRFPVIALQRVRMVTAGCRGGVFARTVAA